MTTLALIVGLWTSACIQTQIAPIGQGFVIESFDFSEAGEYRFTREWFKDSACTNAQSTDTETGSIKLGHKMSGMFVVGETYEADFKNEAGVDYGAISIRNTKMLKVARGLKGSHFRNTMVGIFDYVKR